jgi:hypothetical protein
MKKISSGNTFLYKWVIPVAWFGFLATFFYEALSIDASKNNPLFLLTPVLLAAAGFFVMKKAVWVLVDEVQDFGAFLVVKNRGRTERVELASVLNVTATTLTKPSHVTLHLSRPRADGTDEITFASSTADEVAGDLVVRADKARRGAA